MRHPVSVSIRRIASFSSHQKQGKSTEMLLKEFAVGAKM
jgi:hypothetical protein